jgi:hypothetical protein
MRVPSTPPTIDLPADVPEWLILTLRGLQERCQELSQAINGNLGFGDAVDVDNIKGEWIDYTTNAIANTEDTIPHNLGEIPKGWIEFSRDKAGVLYKGPTAWTASDIYLKNSLASVAVRIFVYAGS